MSELPETVNATLGVCLAHGRKSFEQNSNLNPTSARGTTTAGTRHITDCYSTFHTFDDGTVCEQRHFQQPPTPIEVDWKAVPAHLHAVLRSPREVAATSARAASKKTVEPTLPCETKEEEFKVETAGSVTASANRDSQFQNNTSSPPSSSTLQTHSTTPTAVSGMSEQSSQAEPQKSPAKQHKPLVVGRTKPQPPIMDSADGKAMNEEIKKNVETNTEAAAPAEGAPKPKKEKAPKQPKAPKAAPPTAPLSPALIDLRVGHILRAINHPNADSLYVSTIAMGDPEGTEHTQVDEETGKVVRTVCSGLNGLVPLAEMQDRKVIVVANLKPVNMRSIKSAAMVLAASPPAEEGADPHAADRVVELVLPPEGAEAGEPVYFDGWEYGEGKGPEKQLNPKKKQWEAIQPGFYTSEDLVVGFDAGKSEVEGDRKGELVVKGKGKCTVKTLKGAVVR